MLLGRGVSKMKPCRRKCLDPDWLMFSDAPLSNGCLLFPCKLKFCLLPVCVIADSGSCNSGTKVASVCKRDNSVGGVDVRSKCHLWRFLSMLQAVCGMVNWISPRVTAVFLTPFLPIFDSCAFTAVSYVSPLLRCSL